MARVDLERICKSYPGVTALDNVELTVEPGEFFTLLGPVGLRQDHASAHDRRVQPAGQRRDPVRRRAHRHHAGAPAQHRHGVPGLRDLSAQERGRQRRLRPRDAPRAAAEDRRSAWHARSTLVQLGGLAARMPHELSGGQQQRVALARAMVINPQILLMDEPLSNLDAKLRIELRDDIRDLQRSLGITTIYVTHDQEEALVISDRICIMQGGRVHQVAPPLEVYGRPATLFVASFVGSMNVFERLPVGPGGEVDDRSRDARAAGARRAARRSRSRSGRRTSSCPAPERDAGRGDRARRHRRQGDLCRARSLLPTGRAPTACGSSRTFPGPITGRLAAVGERLAIALPLARLHAFDPADGRRVELAIDDARGCASISGRWSWSLAFAVLGVLLIWPLSSIFTASFIDNTTREPTLGNYARVLGQPFFQTALVNSLIVGVGGMLGAMLLGVPLAALTARYVIVGRDFLATLAVLALVSPPFIGAYAWIMMLGRNGFVRAAAGGDRHRAAVDLRLFRHHSGLQPQVLPIRVPARVEQPAHDQSVGRGGRGRPRRRALAAFFRRDAAAGVSGGERRGAADLRAVPRRFRHARDRRREGARAGDHGLQPLHQRNDRQSRARVGDYRRADRAVAGRRRAAARLGAPAQRRRQPDPQVRAEAARAAGVGRRARRLLCDRAREQPAVARRHLHVVPQDQRAGLQARLRARQLRRASCAKCRRSSATARPTRSSRSR